MTYVKEERYAVRLVDELERLSLIPVPEEILHQLDEWLIRQGIYTRWSRQFEAVGRSK